MCSPNRIKYICVRRCTFSGRPFSVKNKELLCIMFGRLDNSFDLFFSFFLTQVFFVVQSSSPPIQLGDDADVSKVPKIFASHFPNAGFSSSFFFCCFSFFFFKFVTFFYISDVRIKRQSSSLGTLRCCHSSELATCRLFLCKLGCKMIDRFAT